MFFTSNMLLLMINPPLLTGSPYGFGLVPYHLLFQPALHPSKDRADDQIEHRRLAIQRKRLEHAGGDLLRFGEEFHDGNARCQRGILGQANQRVEQRRERNAKCLRHYNPCHRLGIGQAVIEAASH